MPTTRYAYETLFAWSDEFDRGDPYTEWKFTVRFDARCITEGSGRHAVEIDMDPDIELTKTIVWCGDSGQTLGESSDEFYKQNIETWFREKFRTDEALRASIDVKCAEQFSRETEG